MDLGEFFDLVEAHEDLEGVGVDNHEGDPAAMIRHTPSGLLTRAPLARVEETEWPVLAEILTGKRDPMILHHMTRVVGYFSRVENWNKSKIGELHDRHRGDYCVTAAAESHANA